MSYTVAGIDVHKKLLVVVAADISQPEWQFQCRRFFDYCQRLVPSQKVAV